ncbi:hypothetical protein KSP39_PZI023600 [Platanthera zijinensis]|uniref:CCHC-type domain-containing protein n=1 Tax=Platanthera zijinensis TaxID=2320716 RepID=A0AAP0AST7_9ASPA
MVAVDLASPYYLHPSDHPGMTICPVVLKGDNFQEWEKSIRNAFRAKRKLSFLDGMVPKPDDDAKEIEDWWSVNSMLVAWVLQSIEPSLRSTITYYETVQELWDDLQQRFSIGNGPRIHQLRSDLTRCVQRGQNVATYYGHLKKIWDELSTYVKARGCNCGHCTCNWMADLSKEREDERLHQFLMGLDDDLYGTLRSNILAQDPLPPLNRAYALVVQEERHKTMTKSRDTRNQGMAFAMRDASSRRHDKPTCVNCGHSGHVASSCFKIIGYPEWWNNGRGNDKGIEKGKGGKSTSAIGRGKGVANAAQNANIPTGSNVIGSTNTAPLTSQDRTALIPALNDDQWNVVLNMFKNITQRNSSNEHLTGPHFEDGDWGR